MLTAEALLVQSWPIFFWLVFFYLANVIYFPLFEERSLEKKIWRGLPHLQKTCGPLDPPPDAMEAA